MLTYTHKHMQINIYVHIHVYVCMYVCVCVCVCVCLHACVNTPYYPWQNIIEFAYCDVNFGFYLAIKKLL